MKANKQIKFRNVITILWGMLFCFNSLIALSIDFPSILNWILVGFPAGVVYVMLITNPLLKSADKLIGLQRHLIDMFEKETKKEGRKPTKRWKI